MNKAIVAIGVDKIGGGLPMLRAAAKGAKDVAEWAKTQGFEKNKILLFTDENDSPVKLSDITSAVFKLVNEGTYEQLIIYFSGHGLLKAPNYEIWLLSDGSTNPNEAINVSGSIDLARNSGIPHVVFISDACRSIPSGMLMYINGGVIFPFNIPRSPSPEVDVFYATLPGDPALEIPPDKAANQYRGIFTDCLMKALKGEVDEVIQPDGTILVVPSRPVKNYLLSAVPEAAGSVSIKLQQAPDIRVESALPKYLSKFSDNSFRTSNKIKPIPDRATVDQIAAENFFHTRIYAITPLGILFEGINQLFMTRSLKSFLANVEKILSTKGREAFETRTGFTVHGAKVINAITDHASCDVFTESNLDHIRVNIYYDSFYGDVYDISPSERTYMTVIRFANGGGTCLAVIPGYIGTVIVEDNRIIAVNYTPSRNGPFYEEYQRFATELERRRAFVSVAARNGFFRLNIDTANDAADYLRKLKCIDPSLGIYSAYAYNQTGNQEGVQSIFNYMNRDRIPVPFDVTMLAYRNKPLPESQRFPPMLPMLTQGWALLGNHEKSIPPALLEARNHLIPSLWTTFTKEGIDILERAIQSGEIK